MTDCTERHPAGPHDGLAGEGQEGMTKGGTVMTDCTERHPAGPHDGLAGEGQGRHLAASHRGLAGKEELP
jgi:hypothetical protein